MVVERHVSSVPANEASVIPQATTANNTVEGPSTLQLNEGGIEQGYAKNLPDMATSRLERRPSLCTRIGSLLHMLTYVPINLLCCSEPR